MNGRMVFLDSLRGYAAISVVIGHYWSSYGTPEFFKPFKNTPLALVSHGAGAVALFFVLSGFVLSNSFLKKPEKLEKLTFVGYSIKRVFRIYPLFLFGLIISFLFAHFLNLNIDTIPAETGTGKRFWSSDYTFKRFILESNLFVYLPKDGGIRLLPQDWTLSIELLISIFIPFFCFIQRKKPISFILLGLFLIYLDIIHLYFFGFFLGMILALYYDHIIDFFKNKGSILKWFALITGILLYTFSKWAPAKAIKVLDLILFDSTTLGAAFILLFLLVSKGFQKSLSRKFTAFIGEISYGIYLTHYFVLLGLMPLIFKTMNGLGLVNNEVNNILGLIVLMGITFGVSAATYSWIEKPFIKLGKRAEKKSDKYFQK